MKNNYNLLPFIREDIYGLNPTDIQFYGWEIKTFNIPAMWKHSKGEGIKVGVIDTGCDLDHPDIKNNISQGINLISKNKDPIDDNGHGTHVSGTIAAEDNGIGMVGVAPKTKIVPIKALDAKGSGNNQNIINGIIWAADNKCDFICMSFGSPYPCDEMEKAIKYATNKGTIVFCAAGNSGEKSEIMYPAKYNSTISIGAIDKNLNRASFTCSGEELDFLSPGYDIVSCVPDNSYASMSGTSMSTPFAVGCASLLLSYARQIKFSAMDNLLKKPEDYINIFKTKSKSLKDPKYAGIKKYQGYGIIYPVL
jgi:major intracellular serine protease